ncbi:hypothetical protein QVD17_31385 [Tagetes erecta]|uniref:Uncharacterized protein n=1 Tax=Tagetes erecta TaxID=13708 RepID=A0AAD8K7E6_TARER|nr:hypothetical protein QVD17_31385 [Tagetes erecta]
MASQKMSLKLLVDKKAKRVVFAEVPKEFVDFLFHIFSLPLGTLIEFMSKDEVEDTMELDKKKINRGYVKEVVTYMVMDDLVVKPMSTISSITLINKFGVKDLSQLEEKTVSFGKDEGLKLLMASLKTDKVLTTVFMQ